MNLYSKSKVETNTRKSFAPCAGLSKSGTHIECNFLLEIFIIYDNFLSSLSPSEYHHDTYYRVAR